MYLLTSTSAAVALLGCVSSIYGHALVVDAYGNANEKIHGRGLGTTWGFNKGPWGTDMHPWQVEVSIFSNTAIPCCGKPRHYQPQGCGLSLYQVWKNNINTDNWLKLHGWHSPIIQNVFQAQRSYSLDVNAEVNKFASGNLIAQVTAGGWLRLRIHQVNADGGGLFKCKVDPTGMGRSFGAWGVVKENIPGDKHSISWATIHKPNLWITYVLPADIRCTGTFGKMKNICLVRCENSAVNGPFGSCVPVQQIIKDIPKPKPIPKPIYTPKPVKPVPVAPPTKEELKVGMGGEEYSEEVTKEIMEKQKIPVEEKEVLAEAKDANYEAGKEDENDAMEAYN
ncbi:hypothetical protein TWF730_004440 [Orbilia blumenaviensis]|uniref:Uncharacterized protein n=1 Tax=Orbilia blumenaviensis TaxID=1796055 RepID=A0AAV9TZY1_9PEZI